MLDPDRLHFLSVSAEENNQVLVGLLNVDFTFIPPEAFEETNPKIEIDSTSGQFKYREIPGKDPYLDLQAVVIGPYEEKVEANSAGKVTFNFLYGLMQQTENPVKTLFVDFGDGTNHLIIEDNELKTFYLDHTFSSSGEKILHFTGSMNNGSPIDTYARLYVEIPAQQRLANITVNRLRANEYFHNYPGDPDIVDDNTNFTVIDKNPEIEYGIAYATGTNGQLRKPIIITDGYDPGDERKPTHIYRDFRNLIDLLRNNGYDVIIANFPRYLIGQKRESFIIKHHNGGPDVNDVVYFYVDYYREGGDDYIERNAKALEALIRHLNAELAANGSQEQLVVIGPSMGGLITRYALAEMEQNGENHNTRLWVAFDAPFQGANIPAAYQFALKYYNTYSNQFIRFTPGLNDTLRDDFGIYDGLRNLYRPAPQQMLVDHLRSVSNNVMRGGSPHFRSRFMQNLNAMGYPHLCRKVALINGSFTGHTYASPASSIVDVQIYLDLIITSALFELNLNFSGTSGTNEALHVYLPRAIRAYTGFGNAHKFIYSEGAKGSVDVSPGSYYALPITNNSGDPLTPDNFTPFSIAYTGFNYHFHLTINSPFFSFIPTKSALDFQGNPRLNEDLCANYGDLVLTNHTPFDSYYAPTENQAHISLDSEAITWLMEEINGNPQPPQPQNCDVQLILTGPRQLCPGDQGVYQTNIPVTWTVTNLNIISQTPTQLVVEKTNPVNLSEVHAVSSNGQVQSLTVYCHPVIDTDVMDHTVHLVSGDNSISLNDQNITDVIWEQTHGNASMTFADASEARFVGGDYYGTVTVTNNKGSTTKVFFGPDPDQCYIIKKVGEDKFQVIDRCSGYTVIATMPLKEIYDEMGTKLGDVPVVNDKLDVSQSGNSGDIRIIRVNVNGETVTKRFIKD